MSFLRQDITKAVQTSRTYDLVFYGLCLVCMVVVMGILLSLIAKLAYDGAAQIDWDFLTNYPSRKPERAGLLSAWVGTVLAMVVAGIVVTPLGVGAGVYLQEYAPRHWLSSFIEVNISNLAGVPSIIYGILALGVLVHGLGMGETLKTAGVVLALLVLPVVIVATREALRSVPQGVREAAVALGADRWQTVRFAVLPMARPGIMTGVVVGLSRAIGETAPVITIGALTFVAFLPPSPFSTSFPFINFAWLDSPFTLVPIQMFNWISRPKVAFHELAAGTGLMLLIMTLLMNVLAFWLRYRLRQRQRMH